MSIDITAIIVAIIGVVGTIIGGILVKNKVPEIQYNLLKRFATDAVWAAEQLGLTDVIESKFKFAMDFVKNMLSKYNLKFSDDDIKVALESEVLTLNKQIEELYEYAKLMSE